MRVAGLLAICSAALAIPGFAEETRRGLSATDIFAAASEAQATGQFDDAVTFLQALTRDADLEIRTEARFRMAMLLSSLGRNADAAGQFRAILDEKPDAARVRLELARVLAQMGDESGARRALRQAQAAGLPPEVATVVDQFAAALRSRKTFGGSLELALAPDSNINRATSASTLDTVIAPLTLSDDARAQSGLGLSAGGQLYARVALAPGLSLVPRASGQGRIYGKSAFNDISGSALLGLEWLSGRDRLTPSAGRTWRWYGGKPYATTDAVTLNWLHPVGQRAQVSLAGSAARARYKLNPLQSGGLFDATLSGELALSPRAGIGASVGATRQDARDPGYATTAGTVSVLGWRDAGKATVFASVAVRRTVGDERLSLFPELRKDWLLQVSGGATLRWLTFKGFAPVVRLALERNSSTVGLYDYRRLSTELGIARAF